MTGQAGKPSSPVLFSSGFFSSAWKAWLALLVYVLSLYASLSVTYDFYILVFNRVGRDRMSLLIDGFFLFSGLLLLLFLWLYLPGTLRAWVSFLLLAALFASIIALQDVPANRIHFIQYTPLAILLLEALRFRFRSRVIYIWCLLGLAVIGLGDESLQSLMPNRFFDVGDILVNTLAGVFALAFVVLVMGERNYPWGALRPRRESR